MESRASYIVVGFFVLAMAAGAVGFVVWLTAFPRGAEATRYALYFTDDLTSLDVGSTVRYRGVPVGRVATIRIDPGNVERTRVVIALDPETPIKTDTVAEIQSLGVTGVTFIQLSGGTQTAASLLSTGGEGDSLPVIETKPSALQQVVTGLPELLSRAVAIGDRLVLLLDKGNIAALSETLENLNRMTATLAGTKDGIEPLADKTRKSLAALEDAASELKTVAATLDAVIAENRAPLKDFTQGGLREFTQLSAESRLLVDSLIRLSQQIERDPARFFFGDAQQGYQPQ